MSFKSLKIVISPCEIPLSGEESGSRGHFLMKIVVGFRAGFALRRFRNRLKHSTLSGSKSAERRLSEGSPPTALKRLWNCHPLSLAEYVGNFAPIGGRASHPWNSRRPWKQKRPDPDITGFSPVQDSPQKKQPKNDGPGYGRIPLYARPKELTTPPVILN